MLADSDAMATIAVKDLETARKFYEEKIGLKRLDKQPTVLSRCSASPPFGKIFWVEAFANQ